MRRSKWTERKFTFDFPKGWMYNIVDRLRGTISRLEALTLQLPEDSLYLKPGETWSIKEHIGHLADLEDLHNGRIDDFISAKAILRAADMSNQRTEKALHHDRAVDELLDEFREKRNVLIQRLLSLDEETLSRLSLHPRLQVMMRPVDMAYFTAEHDDHHLTSIHFLAERRHPFTFLPLSTVVL